MYSKKDQWFIFWLVNGAFLLVAVCSIIYLLLADSSAQEQCAFITVFKTYCPGCGGTRALRALLKLDIIGAFRYHPIVPVAAFAVIAYEIASIRCLIKGEPRGSLIRPWMISTFFAIWLGYSALRIILLYFGIDLLGDILV